MSIRIRTERNVAFDQQPNPLFVDEVAGVFKERAATEQLRESVIDLQVFVAGKERPVVNVAHEEGKGRRDYAGHEVRLRMSNVEIGRHAFPPGIEVGEVKALGDRSDAFSRPLETEATHPGHLGLAAVPAPLPEALRTPPFIRGALTDKAAKRGNEATTIFAPDNRFTFNDTRYPWSTCGRVDSPLGFGSGVMVGPRHLLTVSHIIQWNADGTAGWVRFRPSFFDGSAPFGEAWGVRTYFKWKVSGPTIDFIEGMFDYVCVVLNNRIGDLTGWMGSRGYTDSWDGQPYWSHIGYPGDLSAGNRPSFQNGISLDGAWYEFDSNEAMDHRADVWPGQSGGPFFGWWSGDVGPRAVAVQSSQNPSNNDASGGQDLVDLIIQARNSYP